MSLCRCYSEAFGISVAFVLVLTAHANVVWHITVQANLGCCSLNLKCSDSKKGLLEKIFEFAFLKPHVRAAYINKHYLKVL